MKNDILQHVCSTRPRVTADLEKSVLCTDSVGSRHDEPRHSGDGKSILPVCSTARPVKLWKCEDLWTKRSRTRPAALRAPFLTLDTIVLPEQLKKRPSWESVPHFLKGPFCNVLRLALEEAVRRTSFGMSGVGNCCCSSHACCCSTAQSPRTNCTTGSDRLPEASG